MAEDVAVAEEPLRPANQDEDEDRFFPAFRSQHQVPAAACNYISHSTEIAEMLRHSRNASLLIGLVLCTAGPLCADGDYRVQAFQTDRVYEQPANDFWEPTAGFAGAAVPDSVRLEDFTLRRKSGKREYSLFPGTMREGVYRKLFAFRVDGALFKDRFHTKFYSSREAVWFRDMEDVYFQDDLVFADQPLLFWNRNGEWVELRSQPRKSVKLVLRSDPPGAMVFLNGKQAGITPMTRLGLAEPFIMLKLELPGHYVREEPVELALDSEIVVDWSLHKLLPEDAEASGDTLPLAAWSKPTAPNLKAYEERYQKVAARIDSLKAALADKCTVFDSLYPSFKPKEEFEKEAGFKARDSAYRAGREKEWRRAAKGMDSILREHERVLDRISSFERPFQNRILGQILAEPELALQRYDADRERYPFKLKEESSTLHFTYHGAFRLDPDQARALKARPESLVCEARFWNLEARRKDGRIHFPALDTLTCAFDRSPVGLDQGGRFEYDTAGYHPGDLRRAWTLAASFDSSRQEDARLRRESEHRKAILAVKKRNRRIWFYSGLTLLALAAGMEYLAFDAKGEAEAAYEEYRLANSMQSSAAARAAVEKHDRTFIWLGATWAGMLSCGLVLSIF